METSDLIRKMRDALVGSGRVDLLKAADEWLGDDDRDYDIAEIDPTCWGLLFDEPYWDADRDIMADRRLPSLSRAREG